SIVAERPLVNKNATNEIHITSAEQIQNLPVRGYANVAALNGGVVNVGGTLFVRGGRSEEVAFYVDGVLQNDPFDSNRSGDLINNSIEEVQVQSGGFNAEYGFANSGLVQVTTKTGGSRHTLSGEFITDEFLSEDEENLGTFSLGYNIYNFAASGPVPGSDKVKYYLAGERQFLRDRRTSSAEHPVGVDPVTGNVLSRGGPLPNNQLSRWNWNGNVILDLRPLQFKIGGNSTRDDWREYLHVYSLFNSQFNPRNIRDSDSYYIKATHAIGTRTFYTATASLFRTEFQRGDVRFFENVEAYGDTSQNPYLRSPGNNPAEDAALAEFRPYGTTLNLYSRNKSTYLGLKADLTHQAGTVHELKGGFEVRRNTIRRYEVDGLRIGASRASNPDSPTESVYRAAFVENIGYNITGTEEVNAGVDGPRHPILAAFYVQDKLEFSDLVLNLGFRYDYFKTDEPTFADPNNIILTAAGNIDPAQLKGDKTYSTFSPRIGLSFPVTDRTVFHAQYGKFTQQPDLENLFTAYLELANRLQAGNFVTLDNPLLEPVKTTAFEIGFRQQIGDNAALDITAYYKELRDLVQARNLSINQTSFATFVNGDYGSVKGLSATFELRRTQRVAAVAAYTLQFAGGTGSAANDAFAINWLGNPPRYPTFVAPLGFDQRHTDNVALDFRTTAGDGPM
ncbi:MAG: TonB-dependent receptor plug domain-containing protein, partial [bacterium]